MRSLDLGRVGGEMCSFLETVGFISLVLLVVKVLYEFLRVLYTTYIGPALGRNVNLKKLGKWAVVTGSTDGIGKAYAQELAKKSLNVVLVSRSPYKLQNVAAELESSYKIKTKIIDVDFTEDPAIYDRIKKEVEGLEIGVLVNNVGMGYPYFEYFADLPNGDKMCQDIIACNIMSTTMMTRIILPQMVERKKGAIINIASFGASIPTPLMTLYSASKAFVDKFSLDLHLEYKSKGITVQSVLPGFVVSNMSKMRRATLTVPMPRDYVQAQLKTVGLIRRTAGYGPHRLQLYLYEVLINVFPSLVGHVALRELKNLRTKALQRLQKEKMAKDRKQQ